MGCYNFGKRNKRGSRLLQFCQEQNLKITNTYFKKREGKRWTWLAPNQTFKSQIDYVLTPASTFIRATDCYTQSNFQFHSDHRLLKCLLKINKKRHTTKHHNTGTRPNPTNKENYSKLLQENLRVMEGKGLSLIHISEPTRPY